MSQVPSGAQLSPDGQWWWDGAQWQPAAEPGESGPGAATGRPAMTAPGDTSGTVGTPGAATTPHAGSAVLNAQPIGSFELSTDHVAVVLAAAGIDLGGGGAGGPAPDDGNPSKDAYA
ncbi:MAG: hypothetical protein WCB85_00080 [Candidatus Dormiibacterota bacterium]